MKTSLRLKLSVWNSCNSLILISIFIFNAFNLQCFKVKLSYVKNTAYSCHHFLGADMGRKMLNTLAWHMLFDPPSSDIPGQGDPVEAGTTDDPERRDSSIFWTSDTDQWGTVWETSTWRMFPHPWLLKATLDFSLKVSITRCQLAKHKLSCFTWIGSKSGYRRSCCIFALTAFSNQLTHICVIV